jgi:hypothetical protein
MASATDFSTTLAKQAIGDMAGGSRAMFHGPGQKFSLFKEQSGQRIYRVFQ